MKRNGNILVALGLGLTAVLVLTLAPGVAYAQRTQSVEPPGDDYAAGDYGRVRYQINGLTVLRANTGASSKADLNSPIFPGDTVLTELNQRTEIQLGGGSIVWVDRESELTFLALPDPYASIKDNTVLQLAGGAVGLSALLANEEEFRIDTPAATVFLLGDGDFRVEVMNGDRVRVTSRRGVAEVVGAGGSVLVRGGSRTEVVRDSTPSPPEPFNTFTSDAFDRWIDDREDQYRFDERYAGDPHADEAYDELPDEVRPYYAELSRSGEWTRTDEYGYVWYPSGVARGWRPYRQGYWNYGPHGYFWVSNEPWGWAPYHYGRWAWTSGLGWGWVPGRVFGGAWVAWSWGSAYVGWAPLDYWNRPVYYGSIYYGGYDPYCWSFVAYNHFHHYGHDYYGYHNYRSVHDIGDPLRDHAIVTRPPREAPAVLAESPGARQRAVAEAKSGRTRTTVATTATAGRTSFTEVESRVAASTTKRTTTSQPGRSVSSVSGATSSRSAATRPSKTPAATVPSSTSSRTSTAGRSMPSYKPQLSTGKPSRQAPSATKVGDTRYRLPQSGASSSGSSSSKPRATESRRSSDPRAIYERMATPRTTREKERSSWGSRRQPSARPSRSNPRPKATTPRSTPSRPRATPSRSKPSRPKATPSRSKPSRPKASPSRSKPRPKASPSRSKPRPKASPSRSRPSRPKASPSRSKPKPKPKSSGRSSKQSRGR